LIIVCEDYKVKEQVG